MEQLSSFFGKDGTSSPCPCDPPFPRTSLEGTFIWALYLPGTYLSLFNRMSALMEGVMQETHCTPSQNRVVLCAWNQGTWRTGYLLLPVRMATDKCILKTEQGPPSTERVRRVFLAERTATGKNWRWGSLGLVQGPTCSLVGPGRQTSACSRQFLLLAACRSGSELCLVE